MGGWDGTGTCFVTTFLTAKSFPLKRAIPLTLSRTHTHTLSQSLSHTHTHTHISLFLSIYLTFLYAFALYIVSNNVCGMKWCKFMFLFLDPIKTWLFTGAIRYREDFFKNFFWCFWQVKCYEIRWRFFFRLFWCLQEIHALTVNSDACNYYGLPIRHT